MRAEGKLKGNTLHVEVLFDRGTCSERLYSGEVEYIEDICDNICIVYEDGDKRQYTFERMIHLLKEVRAWKSIRDVVLDHAKKKD